MRMGTTTDTRKHAHNHNMLFEMDGWVLNQNIKGVPIGGFLSTELMCIWGVVLEINFMQNRVPIFGEVREKWDDQVWPEVTLTPGRQMAFPTVAWVPTDVRFFNSNGMACCLEQTYKLVGTLTLAGQPIALRAMMLRDSQRECRRGHIIQLAPKTKLYFLRNYFLNIEPLRCMIAETAIATSVEDTSAAVLFTRYMDNTYHGFCNVRGTLLQAVRHFIEIFQHILYEVLFKWEPESQFLNWGACSVMCTDTLSLTMMGVPPVEPFFNPEMWHRWPDRWSTNCALVLQSMIPALVHKALQMCNSTKCRDHNVGGLVLRFGYKHYKWEWWYMPLTCRLQALNLNSLRDHHNLKAWVLEGASIAVSLGRGGGCTHTHESSQY